MESLRARLRSLDGKGYGAYQTLRGPHRYPSFDLDVARVPKDPYAPPGTGVFRVRVPVPEVGLRPADLRTAARRTAVRDYITRAFHAAANAVTGGDSRGTGHSGRITVAAPGQLLIERSSVVIDDDVVEVRCFIGLPARGRSINADLAAKMLLDELPEIVHRSLREETLDRGALDRHWQTAEDAQALRDQLVQAGMIAFVADGAVLPRASGVDPRPLVGSKVVPFAAPEALRVTFEVPHGGAVSGMGVPAGVTLIVGGGYHGKSTLLSAIAEGVYDHIPGDGRERCVTVPDAVVARAHPGRPVTGTDISAFLATLPDGTDTRAFTTRNASGSTSQAASVAEALEIGASALLLDEDASATNFLVRDARMQRLVNREDEPITVLLDRVRDLWERQGVSTVLAMGGSGDYFDVADEVIQMQSYRPARVTQAARTIADELPNSRHPESTRPLMPPAPRRLQKESIDPTRSGRVKVRSPELRTVLFGEERIDLADLEQLIESPQTEAIARALIALRDACARASTFHDAIEMVMDAVRQEGLDVLDDQRRGGLAAFRAAELAGAANRLRSLQTSPGDPQRGDGVAGAD